MNTARAFYEFQKMPRGSYVLITPDLRCDVWQEARGTIRDEHGFAIGAARKVWRWTADRAGYYLGCGECATLDEACEAAVIAYAKPR